MVLCPKAKNAARAKNCLPIGGFVSHAVSVENAVFHAAVVRTSYEYHTASWLLAFNMVARPPVSRALILPARRNGVYRNENLWGTVEYFCFDTKNLNLTRKISLFL